MESVINNNRLRCCATALAVSLLFQLSHAGASPDAIVPANSATPDPSSEHQRSQSAADFQLLFEGDLQPTPDPSSEHPRSQSAADFQLLFEGDLQHSRQADADATPARAPVTAAQRPRRPSQRPPARRTVAANVPRTHTLPHENVTKVQKSQGELSRKTADSPARSDSPSRANVVFGPPKAPSYEATIPRSVQRTPLITMAKREPVAETLAPKRQQRANEPPQTALVEGKVAAQEKSLVPVTAAKRSLTPTAVPAPLVKQAEVKPVENASVAAATRQPAAAEQSPVTVIERKAAEEPSQLVSAKRSQGPSVPEPLPSALTTDAKPAELPTYPVAIANPTELPIHVAANPSNLVEGPSEAGSAEAETVAGALPLPHHHAHRNQNCPPGDTIGPQSPCPVNGFHCIGCGKCRALQSKLDWRHAGPIPWEAFGHGEYIGPARTADVPEYRLRVDDIVDFVFRLTREVSSEPYRLEVGDIIEVQSLTSPEQNKQVEIQSDGTISLGVLGQVSAAGRTIAEFRAYLDEAFSEFIKNPGITVTPIDTNTKLDDLIATVDNRFGRGGQARPARITPEGTVQLPAIGSVPAQGLTLDELKREIDARYTQIVDGLGVTPILQERAPTYVFVVGEVANPGRFTLEGPTTVMQSIALAGSWNIGADLRHVIVFRRDYNWNLMATRLDIRGALYGRKPCPADEIWIRDSDIVVVPKHPIRELDDAIELLFTRGAYAVFPVNWSYQLRSFSQL